MVAIVDCNNFYCSCERVFDPSLVGKPVIVLSNNDGCAISRSDEAKALGIAMGSPAFMIQDLVQKYDVKVFSSNYTLYADMSKRVLATIATLVPKLEIYSIDEAFLDLSDLKHHDLYKLCKTIREKVIQNTGIPVSIGVAKTKTLAKIANRLTKKKLKKEGVFIIDNEQSRIAALKEIEVGDVWGIGGQHKKKLNLIGIKSAYDFSILSQDYIRKEFSVIGLRTRQELLGIPSIVWTFDAKAKKGICTSRSFGKLSNDINTLSEAIANFAANCAAQLRMQHTCCKSIHIFIQTNPHRSELKQCFRSIDVPLPVSSNNSAVIIKNALYGLSIIFEEGFYFMKAGVIVNEITPETAIQAGIFQDQDSPKSKIMMNVLDKINADLGKDIVRLSAQGYERNWKLKAEKLSNRFTTDFKQLPLIKL